jgi:hypothetical protein
MKKILSQNFSLFSPMSLTPLINIHSRISPRIFSKKFEMILLGYSWAQWTLIYEKNLKSKISCQTLCREGLFILPYNDLAIAQGPKIYQKNEL